MKKVIFVAMLLLVFQGATAQGVEAMKIKIMANDVVVIAELNDTPTAMDFASKLPLKLKMNRHQNREYYSAIKLAKNTKTQNGYKIGDLAYWATGESFVLFYGQGYTDNLIILGEIISGLEKISAQGQQFDALIEKVEE